MDIQSRSTSATEILVEQFLAKTLSKSQWTHEAHLRVGLWHVKHHGADAAINLLRQRIRAYNESVGTQNSDSNGYHETITQLYVLIIAKFLNGIDLDMSIDQLGDKLIALYGDRNLPLQYYSREKLFSTAARLRWMEPDRCQFPEGHIPHQP